MGMTACKWKSKPYSTTFLWIYSHPAIRHPRLWLVILMTDTRRVKRCIIIIITHARWSEKAKYKQLRRLSPPQRSHLWCSLLTHLALSCLQHSLFMLHIAWSDVRVCGNDTIAILWIQLDIMCWVKWRKFIALFKKIESVSLRKCPHDYWLTNKVYLNAITVTNILVSSNTSSW